MNVNQMQTPENYVKNLRREKLRSKERDCTKSKRIKKITRSSQHSIISLILQDLISLLLEENVYLHELLAWRR